MSALTAKPVLNPQITGFISGTKEAIQSKIEALTRTSTDKFPWLAVLVILAVAIGLIVWYFKKIRLLETQSNITRITKNSYEAQARYTSANQSRKGLRDYLQALSKAGVPAAQLCLTNFTVSTVNAGGIFFPGADGVVSPLAATTAVAAGARGFVFDIWPDLTPGNNYSPIIQIVESGSLWRRTTLNSLSFITILRALIREALEIEERPGHEDPVFLYLRFRGKPRESTYTATAAALRAVIEPYRLESAYNNCRSQDKLFSIPMSSLYSKVVVFSNVRGDQNALGDYINAGPRDGVKLEWGIQEARGISEEARLSTIRGIQQNLTWVAPLSESDEAESNGWNYAASHDIGIQFTAMNFWNNNQRLKEYMDPKLFGTQSFGLKPIAIRYIIEVLPKPGVPQDPGWGSGQTAGSITVPQVIKLPGV
jgi:hypothetical protein